MPRLLFYPSLPLIVVFLLLCFIGLRKDENPVYTHYDRADGPLLAYRIGGSRHGLSYRSPTGTYPTTPLSTGTSPSAPTSTCYNPPPSVAVVGGDAANKLCQCPSSYYKGGYYRVDYGYNGKARCEAALVPVYSNQTRVVDDNASFSQCMGACVGSFDKKKRAMGDGAIEARQYSPYWFCHGVNFVPGELCEFVGAVSHFEFPTPGVQSWDNGLTEG